MIRWWQRTTACLVPAAIALASCSSGEPATTPGHSTDAGPDGGNDDVSASGVEASTTPDANASPDSLAGACSVTGDGRTTVVFVNRCAQVVQFRGSDIADGALGPGEMACRDVGSDVELLSSKRYWGYVEPDPGAGRYSLAEFTFNTDFNEFDWYDLSNVDAFNLPLQIVPIDRPDCRTLSCATDLLASCPAQGRYPEQGPIQACVSPDRDDPNNPVAAYFEASCPDAYSWSGDDQESMAACAGEDYEIVFCPPS